MAIGFPLNPAARKRMLFRGFTRCKTSELVREPLSLSVEKVLKLGTFFHGWRRKIGVMTLVIACAFAGLWARSYYFSDTMFLSATDVGHMLESTNGSILWTSIPAPFEKTVSFSKQTAAPERLEDYYGVKWQFLWMGFGVGQLRFRILDSVWCIPHWSIVIPLTLLSAYLMLSRPRPKKPAEATKPPNEAQVPHA